MKKLFLKLSILLIGVLAISCSQNKKPVNCTAEPKAYRKISFITEQDTILTEVPIYSYYQYVDCFKKNNDENTLLFKTIYKDIKHITKINTNLVSFVLYTEGLCSQITELKLNDIKGVSVYFIKDNKFWHKLFIKDENGNFIEINELFSETNALITNFFKYIILDFIPSIKSPERTAYHFILREHEELYYDAIKNSKEELHAKCKMYLRKLKKMPVLD